MRFLYIDQIAEIEAGKRIRGRKTFPLSEAYLKGHFSKKPLIPGSILIETMAQVTGWLVIYTHQFQTSCVISLINDVEVPADLQPGSTVDVCGEIIDTNKRGSLCRARVEQDGAVIAKADRFIYPHFKEPDPEGLARRFHRMGWLVDHPEVKPDVD